MHWCEHNDVDYVMGIACNSRLEKLADPVVEQASQQYAEQEEKQRLFSEFKYAAASWHQKRRVIAKAEHHSEGKNLRFIVTNLQSSPQAHSLWKHADVLASKEDCNFAVPLASSAEDIQTDNPKATVSLVGHLSIDRALNSSPKDMTAIKKSLLIPKGDKLGSRPEFFAL